MRRIVKVYRNLLGIMYSERPFIIFLTIVTAVSAPDKCPGVAQVA
ncbi:hypothetical protein [Clostridium thermosuccinogenes]|nr:hypothetical protein [Pseudoclostridium thermosuccinogenes]